MTDDTQSAQPTIEQPIAHCKDFMCDLETTGLRPGEHAITSFALMPFKLLNSGELFFGSPFTARMSIPSTRRIDAETTVFREKEGIDRAEAELARLTPRIALDSITEYLGEMTGKAEPADIRIWAKPTKFDIAFLESYYSDMKLETPWHHRSTRDVTSWCEGVCGDDAGELLKESAEDAMVHERQIDNPALNMPHCALYDCYYQVFLMRAAIKLANAVGGGYRNAS